jgi:hypothetical protein
MCLSFGGSPAVADVVSNPTLTGPVTGGSRGGAFGALSSEALASAGYIEDEYFFEGVATEYSKVGVWEVDGRWNAAAAGSADYRVRMLVRRPARARDFNGIVVVEWLNVTGLAEGAADFSHMQEEILREGYAWVGVGAQAAGVNSAVGLKAWDPDRYGSLVHPGDRYSYDIFSQAARAIIHPRGIDPLYLRTKAVLATGRSQSAFRLVTYINAIHPLARLFDGFLIHSRGVNAAGLTSESLAADSPVIMPAGAHIRGDTRVPVLDVQTEGDMTALRSHLTRQAPNRYYRRWEIAGAAHAETAQWVVDVPPILDFGPGCAVAVNAAPHHSVVKAALRALSRWVMEGTRPRQSPDIRLADPTAVPAAIVRDQFGNAVGGIRLPELEAPTATLDGRINSPATPPPPGTQNFCSLFGGTVPFDRDTLEQVYRNHQDYVSRFRRAAEKLVEQGYWLRPEAQGARRAARESNVGK